ncbi:MAG: hypothetical protein ACLUD0_12165 [Eubacterium ramulus]
MLFSIAADFAGHLPLPGTALSGCVIGLLEITNGIYTVSGTEWPAEIGICLPWQWFLLAVSAASARQHPCWQNYRAAYAPM